MRRELISGFGVPESKTIVIPFGLNSTVPNSALTPADARHRLGLGARDKVLLFFGNIAPYKGVEYLVAAFLEIARRSDAYRLIIAGRPKGSEAYWAGILEQINASPARAQFILKIEFVPDAETEIYFKAADVLILPYTHIFQSGVLFLGYNFGLPAIAADVGSLKDDIVEGRTGYVFRPREAADLARVIESYFSGEVYAHLPERREEIREFARQRYSWSEVARITTGVYDRLLDAK